ncbi:defender against death DAD protein [Tilletiaria anomala UBC 951]|uniref:Dolichyl-diphosphooligosaccharide--protein glycosyltransferase subunit OST2 n=1 Tax=Tilletiaria anomala (strain ATCC 24038 / CBS 436.72 / UBC 951) TaxID=1037660 RepID=A0A066W6D4_TILAU|nr:defender against death DAD protein [Tilletiaria anomala UBC 951]KDN46649.1 defender against death DAD protein [Tilletiaria anomala UBC 951]
MSSKAPPRTSSSSNKQNPLQTLLEAYSQDTPLKLKMIDAFLVFLILSGVMQFAYAILVTSFPFNSFIAGFASTVGQFVLAASLRIQANPENGKTFTKISPERAFGDFLFSSVILHFFVVNFLG